MKKIISLILSLTLLLTAFALFTSCGATAPETADTTANESNDTTADEPNTDATVLTMATNASFPPYEFIGDNGDFEGIDVEIATAIAEKLNMTLEIVDTEFGSIIGGVQSGKYDMGMAGMTVTDERKESVNFTDSYAGAVQSVIVPEDSEYASFEDFYASFDADGNPETVKDGITIGVQADTTGDIYCSSDPVDWGFGEANVVRYKTGNDAVAALAAGKVTAVIIDNEPAKSYVSSTPGLKILEGAFAEEEYAICISKDNTELLDKINGALNELKTAGTIDIIVAKYITAE